jgi:hypothetical protein
MRFRPEKIFIGKNADGSSFRIEQWDYDTRAGFELIGNFMSLFAAVIFVQIISPVLLVMCVLNFNGRANILNIIGIALGGYFLYDAYHGWLVTNFLHILLSESIINILVYLNAVSVVLHALLLLFSSVIYNTINKKFETENKCEQAFLTFILVIGWIIVLFTNDALNSNPGWVDKNIQNYLERNKTPEPIEVEQPKPAYDDGFFHSDPNWDPMK